MFPVWGFGAFEAGISLENISKMNFSAIVSNLGVDFTNTSWCSRLVGVTFPGVVIPTDPTTYCNDLGLMYHYVSDIFIYIGKVEKCPNAAFSHE